ncbi:MAG TPA: hypothetical protein PKM78_13870 [Anaerolineae bacterium]|nr:hypothetical protein [Anaerolineae bacterium]HNU04671.1 hypothetical protein [Anaerolineae bacterium]
MNYTDLIQRAARLTWRYKVLWILGILLALSSGGGSSSFNYSFPSNSGGNIGSPMMPVWGMPDPNVIAGFVLLCCCLLAVLIVVLTIVQYVARTGLYRAVDQIEETGAAPTWREALRLGWDRRALRMFLLDLLVGLVLFIGVMALLLLAASPLLLLIFDVDALSIFGGIAAAGLFLLAILLIVVAAVVVSVLQQFWRRQIALDDRSVGDALALGTGMARGRVGDVAIFWILMTLVGLVFGFLVLALMFVLGLAGLAVGGGLGYAVYALFDSTAAALLVGVPLFLLIFGLPLLFVQGIYLVFEASAWTLAYREVRAGAASTAVELADNA